jgi:ABC-2 type transport system ATP-binding protein
MSESAIKIENLTKKFEDKTAVDSLTLQVSKGELFGLLGPNGAGKTTTINILCGLVKPTSGTAKVCGYDVQKEAQQVKELIGVCIQETAIYPYLNGKENLELFGSLYGLSKKATRERSKMLLEKMGLTEDAKRVTGKYSGGMKRRLSLALALIHDPEIAFLDEPTVAIKEQKAHGKTIILTTHYMEEAEELCDRVGVIDHGKLIALGTPQELIAKHGVRNLEEVFMQLTGRNMREEA